MSDPRGPGRRTPSWQAIVGVVAVLALLSAAQIYLRQRAAGQSPFWLWTLTTNLLAWWPWALLTPAVLRLGQRLPLAGERWPRAVAVHALAAGLVAAGYLVYLALFWILFFPEVTGDPAFSSFRRAYGEALGEFFLVAFVGYWLILAVGFGIDALGRYREAVASRAAPRRDPSSPRVLEVRSRGRVRYVDVDQIDWIEAEGSYVRLHVGAQSLLYRRTLAGLEKDLGEPFVRIHRSAVVRLDRVDELRPVSHGEANLRLSTGRELKVSRSYRRHVEDALLARAADADPA